MERQHIIGLEHFGQRLMLAVHAYVRDTDQPNRDDVIKNIYFQAVSQVLAKMTPDTATFIQRLHELPDWRVVDYTGNNPITKAYKDFAEAIKVFGLTLQSRLLMKGTLYPRVVFYLESCSELVAVTRVYEDKELPLHEL